MSKPILLKEFLQKNKKLKKSASGDSRWNNGFTSSIYIYIYIYIYISLELAKNKQSVA